MGDTKDDADDDRDLDSLEDDEIKLKPIELKQEVYWSYVIYVLGVGPLIFAFVTITFVYVTARVGTVCSFFPLQGAMNDKFFLFFLTSVLEVLIGCVVFAYIYILLYTWILIGPHPFSYSTSGIKNTLLVFGFVCLVW